MKIRKEAPSKPVHPSHVQFTRRLTNVPVEYGLGTIDELKDELLGYMDVLLGREDPPVDSPYLGLQEVATAFYARGQEIAMRIHAAQLDGEVTVKSEYYKFRTGILRDFCDAAKKMADLGSRRLTQEALVTEQRYDA